MSNAALNPAIPEWTQPDVLTPVVPPDYGNTDAIAAAGLRQRVYFASRTDGETGTGLVDDPYDASTSAKLHAAWDSISTLYNSIRVFLGGVFEVTESLELPEGCDVEGVGYSFTRIRVAANVLDDEDARIDVFLSTTDGDGNAVRDLTVDGNRANQPSFTDQLDNCQLYAVNLMGPSRCERVRVVNTFNTGSAEAFPVIIASGQGTWAAPVDVYFDDVQVIDHRGYCTAINALGTSNYDSRQTATGVALTNVLTCTGHGRQTGDSVFIYSKSGGSGLTLLQHYLFKRLSANTFNLTDMAGTVVSLGTDVSTMSFAVQRWVQPVFNNVAVTSDRSAGYSTVQGIGCGGWLNARIVKPQLTDLFAGIYCDTHSFEGATILSPYVRLNVDPGGNAGRAIFCNAGGGGKDWRVIDAVIELCPNSIGITWGNMNGASVESPRIIKGPGGGTQQAFNYSASPNSNSGTRIVNSRLSAGLDYSNLPALGTALVFATANRLDDGTASSVPESMAPASGSTAYAKPTLAARYDGGSNSAQSIADNNRADFQFTTQRFDSGSLGSTSTKRFTAPAAGRVRAKMAIAFTVVGGSGLVQLEWLKNGASNTLPHKLITPAATATTYEHEVIDECAQGDYYEPSVFNNAGGSSSINRNFQASWVEFEFTPS